MPKLKEDYNFKRKYNKSNKLIEKNNIQKIEETAKSPTPVSPPLNKRNEYLYNLI